MRCVERLLYLSAVVATPAIPLFFLYSQNVTEGLLFGHFLIFGVVLGVVSLVLYLLISKFWLRRRRTVILLAFFWAFFWFYNGIRGFLARGNPEYSDRRIVVYLLLLLAALAFGLRYIKIDQLVANVIAVMLCVLFVFNFIPEAAAEYAGYRMGVENAKRSELPYEIKREFYVDQNLPQPNIYWLHMDGMMGFSAVEQYFGDPQTELKNMLWQRGFVINESARLEASNTEIAIPSLLSPCFYDNYYAEKLAAVADMPRNQRLSYIIRSMRNDGFSFEHIQPYLEIFKAFTEAGYTNITNFNASRFMGSLDIDVKISAEGVAFNVKETHAENYHLDKLSDFKDLIVGASVLSLVKSDLDKWMDSYIEREAVLENVTPIPDFQEIVDKYVAGISDSSIRLGEMLRQTRYATTITAPRFVYLYNDKAHVVHIDGNKIGEIVYKEYISRAFIYDENGIIYTEAADDPGDPKFYLPQHLYTVKEMIAQLDIILTYDPEAVIVVQADHGIHGIGPGGGFDSNYMFAKGYSLEDQLNLNLQVMSAVRIPPQYGALTQPLDPLDISRYLVNHFVGSGNYEYLYYQEGGN